MSVASSTTFNCPIACDFNAVQPASASLAYTWSVGGAAPVSASATITFAWDSATARFQPDCVSVHDASPLTALDLPDNPNYNGTVINDPTQEVCFPAGQTSYSETIEYDAVLEARDVCPTAPLARVRRARGSGEVLGASKGRRGGAVFAPRRAGSARLGAAPHQPPTPHKHNAPRRPAASAPAPRPARSPTSRRSRMSSAPRSPATRGR